MIVTILTYMCKKQVAGTKLNKKDNYLSIRGTFWMSVIINKVAKPLFTKCMIKSIDATLQ